MSIWHKPDEKPIQRKCIVVKYRAPVKPTCKFVDKDTYISPVCDYAYLDDLIAQADKAERLEKAVDLAIRGLETVHMANSCITKESQIAYEYLKEIEQLIKGGTDVE